MDGDANRFVTARLGGVPVRLELAEPELRDGESEERVPPDGMQSVGLRELDLSEALDTVGHIGTALVDRLRAAMPDRATVEFRIGFAVEAGKLTALWVGGRGEASMTVTLEWSREQLAADGETAEDPDPVAGGDG